VEALQVKNKAGEWIDAPCIPGTFVIKSVALWRIHKLTRIDSIGDQLARWTSAHRPCLDLKADFL
jgi:isopenicillin N synthase-like dioxygenase